MISEKNTRTSTLVANGRVKDLSTGWRLGGGGRKKKKRSELGGTGGLCRGLTRKKKRIKAKDPREKMSRQLFQGQKSPRNVKPKKV